MQLALPIDERFPSNRGHKVKKAWRGRYFVKGKCLLNNCGKSISTL